MKKAVAILEERLDVIEYQLKIDKSEEITLYRQCLLNEKSQLADAISLLKYGNKSGS